MSVYGGRISAVDLSEPLALLWEKCGPGGSITGCGALANYCHGGQELIFADRSRRTFPVDEVRQKQALETGCDDSLEGVSNSGSPGVLRENAGNFHAANRYFASGCTAGMRAESNEYYSQDDVCYWTDRNARNNLQTYADAHRWLGYICDKGEVPFACKFPGLMYAQGQGVTPDPPKAPTSMVGRAV